MIINVSKLQKEIGGKMEIKGELNLSDVSYLGENFHFVRPVTIDGELSNNGTSLVLSASVGCEMIVKCARCMKEIQVIDNFSLDETFIEEGKEDNENPDINVFSGSTIDVSDVVANGFFMNTSGKYLCKDDCKGLCSTCGADLNLGECSCSNEDCDPRWESLKKIMENT